MSVGKFVIASPLLIILSVGADAVQEVSAYSGVQESACKKFIPVGEVSDKGRRIVMPKYPAEAKKRGVKGVVEVEVIIDVHSGKVIKARVLNGAELLREAAVGAAMQWTFYPTNVNSPPLCALGVIKFNFGSRGVTVPRATRSPRARRN